MAYLRYLKIGAILLALVIAASMVPGTISSDSPQGHQWMGEQNIIDPNETALLNMIDSSRLYENNRELERLSSEHLASRSGGSSGADASAEWILGELEGQGLDAWSEEFPFDTWDLLSTPALTLDGDGNPSTTTDQLTLDSFGAEHWSYPSPPGSLHAGVELLPLPPAASRDEVGQRPVDTLDWSDADISGKIVFIGREVQWNTEWQSEFFEKIGEQPPAAIVFIWWYEWNESFEEMIVPALGGFPLGAQERHFWDLEIPTGNLNFSEGRKVQQAISPGRSTAFLDLPSRSAEGAQSNIFARINGTHSENTVMLSAHYDTVTTPGFCDNGGGVSALIEIAGALQRAQNNGTFHPRSSILFAAFAGEELGLVGSANFLRQHAEEMGKVQGIINIDGIGSKHLGVTSTPNSVLDDIVRQAAHDLESSIIMGSPETSDHVTFLNPAEADRIYSTIWKRPSGIADAASLSGSLTLFSQPITYQDSWAGSGEGWIHTAKDSYSTEGWINESDLRDHASVAMLSIARLAMMDRVDSEQNMGPFLFLIGVAAAALMAIWIVVRRKP